MKKLILFAAIFQFTLFNLNAQNIGINATGAAPDAGAMLDISSTNKGLLVPRVSIANLAAIAPIVGSTTVSMLVYNTNATTGTGYHYWDGATWVRLSSGNAWQITGNNNTTFGTHFLGTTNAQGLDFRTNNIIRLRIPNANQIHANANGTAALPFYSWANDANTGMSNLAADQLNWSTGGGERLRLTNTQLATTFDGTAAIPAYSWTTDPNTGMYRIGVDILGFSTTGVERMRIIANGQSAINGVPAAGDVLSVYGLNATLAWAINGYHTGTSGGSGFFQNSAAGNGFNSTECITAGSNAGVWGWNQAAGTGVRGTVANTVVGWAGFFQGDVGCTGTYFGSDERWKKNIRSIVTETSETVLSKLMQIKPKKYEWRADEFPGMGFDPNKISYGFIAQELEQIFPDLVNNKKVIPNPTKEHKSRTEADNVTGYYMVDYIGLIPILTKGIQEQQTIIEAQNSKINALEQLILELQIAIEKK